MTKREVFDSEQQNFGKIILHKEGSFWIAYERSAYWFYFNIKKYKPTKRYFHVVGEEIISLGFPDRALASLADVKILEQEEKQIILETTLHEISWDEFMYNFDTWKEGTGTALPRARPGAAKYDNLPVYKEVYDLTLQVFRSSQHMQRDYRYALGEKIKEELVEITIMVYSANTGADKIPFIEEARRLIEVVRVQMRLLHDLGQVPVNNMASMNFSIDSIARQLTAWHSATVKKKTEQMPVPIPA